MRETPDTSRTDDPRAALERRIVDEYLRGAGHDPHALRERGDAMARSLLVDAASYAAERLGDEPRSRD